MGGASFCWSSAAPVNGTAPGALGWEVPFHSPLATETLSNIYKTKKHKTKPPFFSDCRGIGSILTLSVYPCLPQSLKQIETPDGIDCGLWSPRADTDFLSSSLHQLHNHTSLPNPTSKYTMVLAPYFRITPASLFSSLSFLILLNVYKKTLNTL